MLKERAAAGGISMQEASRKATRDYIVRSAHRATDRGHRPAVVAARVAALLAPATH